MVICIDTYTKKRVLNKKNKKTIKRCKTNSYCLKSNLPLYDNSVIFQYYSKSKDNQLPGMGAGEKISPCNISKYEMLASIPNWRKMLSNLWEPPGKDKKKALFNLGGYRWRTLQHYMEAIKYIKENPKYYYQFSLDSVTELSKNPLLAKKMYKNINVDKDFKIREKTEREKALYAKYSQNIYLRNVLLHTMNAKLIHFRRGKPPLVSNELMHVRRLLRQKLCKNN